MLSLLALTATLASCAPGCECTTFTGTVSQGKEFTRAFGERFVWVLVPTEFGWEIVVRDDRPGENIARLTPPFRGAPNPRYLEGWHFRNVDNSGPNDGSVNAPQERRNFIFSPEVGRSISYPPTPEQLRRLKLGGQGELVISSMKLGDLERGRKARIERMDFAVALSWPSSWGKASDK